MKPPVLAALLVIATPVSAQTVRCDTFADMQTCSAPNGYRSTEMTFGDMTTGRDTLGNTWRSTRWGDTTTTEVTPGFRHP
jgi:hypothetical protein